MAKKGWSSIHGEVKEAKSMKTTVVVWVPKWNKTKRRKNLTALSFLFFLCIYKNRKLLNACMAGSGVCLFS